jgi:hypothetical protein
MNAEALRELIRRAPFLPLEIELSSGERYVIRHPEFAMVLGSRLILGFPETDRTATIALLHICQVRELAHASV